MDKKPIKTIIVNGTEDLEQQLKDIGMDDEQIKNIVDEVIEDNKLVNLKKSSIDWASETFKTDGFLPFKDFVLEQLLVSTSFDAISSLLHFMVDLKPAIPEQNYNDFNALVEVVMNELSKQVKLSFDDDFDKYYTV